MGANFGFAALGCREHFARPRQILGCIDAERHVINDAYVDAHARFERAQLFQFFALLQGGRRQADEARSRVRRVPLATFGGRSIAVPNHPTGGT